MVQLDATAVVPAIVLRCALKPRSSLAVVPALLGRPKALATGLVLLVASCAIAPQARRSEHWHTTRIGLCEDYPEETRTLANARRDLAAAHAAGAKVLRICFGWDAMEAEPGRYDWTFWDEYVRAATEDYGLTLIPYVCYTPKWAARDKGDNYWRSPPRDPEDFARFVGVLIRHYHSRIHSWELWNEPDNQAYWLGTVPEFAALVRAGSAAVREADPGAKVVLGGIAGEVDFLAKLLHDERVGPAVDVINVHNYFETWHPNPIERLPAYIGSVAGLARDLGGRQALWLAEAGYSSVDGRTEVSGVYHAHFHGEHTELAQANAFVRMDATAMATGQLDVFAWYRINDLVAGQEVIGDDNNRHLGIRRVDGAPKPVAVAFSRFAHTFAQPYEDLSPTVSVTRASPDTTPVVRAFRLRDGRDVIIAWLGMSDAPPPREPLPDTRAATLRVTLPGEQARRVVAGDVLGHPAPRETFTWRDTGETLEVALSLNAGEVRIVETAP